MGKSFEDGMVYYVPPAGDKNFSGLRKATKKYENPNSVQKEKDRFGKILKNFNKKFPDEDACQDYLFNWRWPKGFRCPECKHKKCYIHKKRHRYDLYECRKCRYQVSLTAGTIFHRTRTPLHNWFFLIFCLNRTTKKVKLTTIQRNWGEDGERKSYTVIWKMAEKIKKAMRKPDMKEFFKGVSPHKLIAKVK